MRATHANLQRLLTELGFTYYTYGLGIEHEAYRARGAVELMFFLQLNPDERYHNYTLMPKTYLPQEVHRQAEISPGATHLLPTAMARFCTAMIAAADAAGVAHEHAAVALSLYSETAKPDLAYADLLRLVAEVQLDYPLLLGALRNNIPIEEIKRLAHLHPHLLADLLTT